MVRKSDHLGMEKFHHTDKWCINVRENETHKILKDFAIQMVHRILDRRPDLVFQVLIIKKKRTYKLVGFAVSFDQRVKIKRKLDEHLDYA